MEKCITYGLFALLAIVMIWVLATAFTLSNAIVALLVLVAMASFILWDGK